jgi:hypothetical protein
VDVIDASGAFSCSVAHRTFTGIGARRSGSA